MSFEDLSTLIFDLSRDTRKVPEKDTKIVEEINERKLASLEMSENSAVFF